jgi:hypothetical protein
VETWVLGINPVGVEIGHAASLCVPSVPQSLCPIKKFGAGSSY